MNTETTTLCEMGRCKRLAKVAVRMTNFKTGEKRPSMVCKDHLRDVLSACERDGIYAEFSQIHAVAKAEGRA